MACIRSCDLFLNYHGRVWFFGLDFPYDPSRITSYAVECRYVFRHNTSSTNSNTSPYSHSWEHNNVASKPAVVSDCNGLTEFRTVDAISKERIQGVCSGIKRAIRTNESTIADSDQAGIEECAVEVNVDTPTKPARMSIEDGV
jgi:hypothetical protein